MVKLYTGETIELGADGYTEAELELLARVAMESVGDHVGVNRVRFGAPAFVVGPLRFDEGGVYVEPKEGAIDG